MKICNQPIELIIDVRFVQTKSFGASDLKTQLEKGDIPVEKLIKRAVPVPGNRYIEPDIYQEFVTDKNVDIPFKTFSKAKGTAKTSNVSNAGFDPDVLLKNYLMVTHGVSK